MTLLLWILLSPNTCWLRILSWSSCNCVTFFWRISFSNINKLKFCCNVSTINRLEIKKNGSGFTNHTILRFFLLLSYSYCLFFGLHFCCFVVLCWGFFLGGGGIIVCFVFFFFYFGLFFCFVWVFCVWGRGGKWRLCQISYLCKALYTFFHRERVDM